MKKMIMLLLAILLSLFLAACGGEQTGESGEEARETEGTSETAEASGGEEAPEEDLVAVESVIFKPAEDTGGFIPTDFKIRNLSDREQERIGVTYQVLDKNGDILENSVSIYLDHVQPGQGGTVHSAVPGKYEEMGALKLFQYSFWEDGQPKTFDFLEPLTLVQGESTEVDGNTAYSWVPENSAALSGPAVQADPQGNASDGLYGTWEVTEVRTSSGNFTVSEMEAGKVYSWSDWRLIVANPGKVYLQTNNNSVTSDKAEIADTDITAGGSHWTLEDGRLVISTGSATVYYEKISGDQTFPELEKKELIDLLKGTWSVSSASRSGSFTFADKSATATINGVTFEADTLCVLMKENRIVISTTQGGNHISMDLAYSYENGGLTLTYSGDELTKR